MSVLPSYS